MCVCERERGCTLTASSGLDPINIKIWSRRFDLSGQLDISSRACLLRDNITPLRCRLQISI